MFSYEFFKTASLYSYKSFKRLKSLRISHEIFVNLHNLFQEFDILKQRFTEKFISESFNFLFNQTSSHRTFIHKLESSKIVVKTFSNALNFIIEVDKSER